jgi:preprotein translocase subunit SecG
MGAAFGSGTSGSLFGATGSSNFLSRATAVLATVFFIATLALSYLATQARQPAGSGSVMQNTSEVPAAPTATPAPAGTPAASQVPGAPADSGAKK